MNITQIKYNASIHVSATVVVDAKNTFTYVRACAETPPGYYF